MYYYGEGVPQNYVEAAKWFRRATESNRWTTNVWAQRFLGILYYHGRGVPRDYTKAARWFRLVAESGSIANLTGVDGISDYEWYGSHGVADSQWRLGIMYYLGQGIPQDYSEAARWYRLAAEQGYANAQWSLGSLYRFGMGVPKDFVAAHAWFNLAAAQGHGDAAPDRNDLAAQMTAPQITSAQDLARDLWSQVSQMTIP